MESITHLGTIKFSQRLWFIKNNPTSGFQYSRNLETVHGWYLSLTTLEDLIGVCVISMV